MDEFARPLWETDEDRLTATVKHLENKIQLCNELMTASRLMLDAALNDMEVKESEIAQLKAELELTKKQRDQATRDMTVEDDEVVIRHRHGDSVTVIGKKDNRPELCAHLAGRGK